MRSTMRSPIKASDDAGRAGAAAEAPGAAARPARISAAPAPAGRARTTTRSAVRLRKQKRIGGAGMEGSLRGIA
jgi:hypothetical protein